MAVKKEEKNMSFEKAIERLENITALLENGDAELDKALELYSEGVSLIKLCNGYLENAQNEIKTISLKDENNEQ